MKNKLFALLFAFLPCFSFAQEWGISDFPILKKYDSQHLLNIALPIGGIGTGTVSLGGRGELRDWEIMNIPGKNYSTVTKGNDAPFFSIFVKEKSKKSISKALIGPLDTSEYNHHEGRSVNHHGLPRFTNASFETTYPFGQVNLSDTNIPLKVKIKGFNPLIPTNENASGLPIATLTYEISNSTAEAIEVAVCGSMRNFIGKDGSQYYKDWKGDYCPTGNKKNINIYKQSDLCRGIFMYADSLCTDKLSKDNPAWGTIALTTNATSGVSYRTSSRANDWSLSLQDFWDDFSADGVLSEHSTLEDNDPMASLAVKKIIPAHSKQTYTFFITWNFPNRKAWSSTVVGNYYSEQFGDAWDVAQKTIPTLPALENETKTFINALLSSSYPSVIKEAALFNLANLRSQTVFRIPDGHLMGWEGIMEQSGSCEGSCTHVWNYEVATHFLFGNLARTMRDVEFNYATKENGLMNFRTSLPLENASKGGNAAADGQMGCIMKFYLDWQMYGNNRYLKENWSQVKKVLSFAWIKGGWDGNQDGVMEGSQHNTMDVNYFGPNPQMQFWYMGALKAGKEMAQFMKDKAFEAKCNRLYKSGSEWMDKNLFNGEYYEHKITDPKTFQFIDCNDTSVDIPPYQLGKGCLVDQLVGQYMASISGLGYLCKKENIQTTLQSIMKYNFLPNFSNHFNNMRSYVLGNEAGLLMASWPKGRLKVPFPYFTEVMTGFEYVAATNMLYEGQEENALKCIDAIRNRFDGAKRSPFNETECGYHYARAMSSWATILALSDFRYSGVTKSIGFTSKPGKYFWSNGYSWGMCTITPNTANIEVIKGSLELNELTIKEKKIKLKNLSIKEGQNKIFKL